MKQPIQHFFRTNASLLSFGLLLTFFSGFGQTFLLSLYVPSIESFLSISNTEFGTIYAVATIGSAFTLPWIGGYFDKVETRRYTLIIIAGLFVSLLMLSFSYHVVMVIIAFYGLRLFGQGLMSHTSVSAMAKYFEKNRGKAIGITSLGHPAGEAVLPILITMLIGFAGWRGTLQISALITLLIVAPAALLLLHRALKNPQISGNPIQNKSEKQNTLSVWQLLKERKFWIISPVTFILGFTNTAIFFFQLKLGAAKGWSPEWVAGSISAFALAGAVGVTGIGAFVDRYTAKKLFPYHMLLYMPGLVALIFFDHPLVYPIALVLFGLGHGTGKTIKDAMLAEIYGTEIIGRVRSVFITVMVFSTAIGPVVFGIFLDAGVSYATIFTGVLIAALLATTNAFRKL